MWMKLLEDERLTTLLTVEGKGRWVLNARLPGQDRAMVSLWNDKGASLSPYRTVMQQQAALALAQLDEQFAGEIGANSSYVRKPVDKLLSLIQDAYVESAGAEPVSHDARQTASWLSDLFVTAAVTRQWPRAAANDVGETAGRPRSAL